MTARESVERAATLAILVARRLPADSELGPWQVVQRVFHLQRIARQAKAIGVRQCNGYSNGHGGWDADAEKRDESREASLGRTAAKIVAQFGAGYAVKIGGDPRGPCAWITIPGEPGEGFSHDGKSYAIY